MRLKDMSIEEIELMSYKDLTYALIKELGKPMNTPTVFREICNLLGYSDSEYEAKIGDYYTSLTIDKRFVLLDSNEWDIRDNHSVAIVIDDEDEDIEVDEDIKEDLEENEIDDDNDDDDVLDDDLDDLEIIDEDDLEEE